MELLESRLHVCSGPLGLFEHEPVGWWRQTAGGAPGRAGKPHIFNLFIIFLVLQIYKFTGADHTADRSADHTADRSADQSAATAHAAKVMKTFLNDASVTSYVVIVTCDWFWWLIQKLTEPFNNVKNGPKVQKWERVGSDSVRRRPLSGWVVSLSPPLPSSPPPLLFVYWGWCCSVPDQNSLSSLYLI